MDAPTKSTSEKQNDWLHHQDPHRTKDSKHVQPNWLPTRAVNYAEDRVVARVAFLCDNKKQCDHAADALRKALERCAVDNAIFMLDYRQRDTILEAMNSVKCHFQNLNFKDTGSFINEPSTILSPLWRTHNTTTSCQARDHVSSSLCPQPRPHRPWRT